MGAAFLLAHYFELRYKPILLRCQHDLIGKVRVNINIPWALKLSVIFKKNSQAQATVLCKQNKKRTQHQT